MVELGRSPSANCAILNRRTRRRRGGWLAGLVLLLTLACSVSAALWRAGTPVSATTDTIVSSQMPELTLSPARQEVTFDPGVTYRSSITVTNSGDIEATFTTAAGSYFPNEDGSLSYDVENNYSLLASWITFDQESYTLAAGESATVTFTIEVPEDAPGGGQYAAIYAVVGGESEAGGIQSVSRVGSLLVARVNGDVNESGEVLLQSLPTVVLDGKLTPTASVVNTGNVNFTITSSLKVQDILSGNVIYSSADAGTEEIYLYPGLTRTFSYSWDEMPSFGIFQVEYTLTFAGESHTVSRLVWAIPFWLVIVILAFLIFMIVFAWLAFASKWLQRRRAEKIRRRAPKL